MSSKTETFARVNRAFDDARVYFAKYAEGPQPVDLYERQRWTMASLHLVVVNSFQNVYKKADSITPEDAGDFAQYCLFSHEFLDHHHWYEETIGFPMMAPEFECDAVEEHAQFAEGMDHWQAYLASILGLKKNEHGKLVSDPTATKVPYDAGKMKKCIEDLSEPLLFHLRHEIEQLAPENLRASGLPLDKLKKLEQVSAHHFKTEVDHFSQSYFTVAHIQPGGQFPVTPWFVKGVLMPYVLYWKHRAVWRFVPVFESA